MAAIKRKAATHDTPHKKVKSAKVGADLQAADHSKNRDSTKQDIPQEPKPITKSVLLQEDRAFPRGGASILTPLEQRQIKAQAERDVLFEQHHGQSKGSDEFGEDVEGNEIAPTKAKRPFKTRRSAGDKSKPFEKSGVPIYGLSFKNLVVGSSVLGRVSAITDRDVALTLPNNLTGFVPITAVSERFTDRIEKLLQDDRPESNSDEDVDLKHVFYLGQWLRAAVTSNESQSTQSDGKLKRHIELTVDPRTVNGGLEALNVVHNGMLQAVVRSVEDHGVVMDLCLSDSSVKGFISKKELGAAYDPETLQEGQVMLCLVTGKSSNGKVIKLSPDASRFSVLSGGKNGPCVSQAPSVEGFQVGTAVDLLITESSPGGVAAKIMGMLDVVADLTHATNKPEEDLKQRYKVGSKTKGRIIWTLPRDDGTRKIGVSLLDQMLALPPPATRLPENASAKLRAQSADIEQQLRASSIVEEAKVVHVLPGRGVYLILSPATGAAHGALLAFAGLSQLSDKPVDTLSSTTGPYRTGSIHRARIMSYNAVDKIYYVSLQQSILEQKFLRLEDVVVGERVNATVLRLILGANGISGVLVKLSDGVEGFIPELHLSDVRLQHPERKFKEGFFVKARVLHVDPEKRQLRLTAKKTLVDGEDEFPIWTDSASLRPGMESTGTIVKLSSSGALLHFYGTVRAWLPAAEMSETFVERPEQHFRLGQTLKVKILSIDPENGELKVSHKNEQPFNADQQATWDKIANGELVSGVVSEKTADTVSLDLDNGLRGMIRANHLTDGHEGQVANALKKLHVGKPQNNLVVLGKLARSRFLLLTKKPSMVADAKDKKLIRSFADLQEGVEVHGFVRNVTPDGVFVEFAGDIVGFLPKSLISLELLSTPSFGFSKDNSITCWVLRVERDASRFVLTMREPSKPVKTPDRPPTQITNPVDNAVTSIAALTLGAVVQARIASVKSTQLNMRLADNVQGRIDISEAFENWEEIQNKKCPLQKFKSDEILQVKILGIHDTKSHRFLPISHRQSTIPVYELSAKRSRIAEDSQTGLSLDSMDKDDTFVAFVNNHQSNYVWASISPSVRGRINLMDLSDDPGQLLNIPRHFPIGCALRVKVKNVDVANNRLDLSAKVNSPDSLAIKDIIPGSSLAGRITKITERLVVVELAENLIGTVSLVELCDNYDELVLTQYKKNDIVRVHVLDVDVPNKKIFLSMRPSKVLSSNLPVKDPQITRHDQLHVGDIVRGFVHNVGEKGVYVQIGARIDAMVRVTDLSDQYIKDWKSIVQIDQLVKGRVIFLDVAAKQVHLSLKASHTDENYVAPITIQDLKPDMIVTGKVRKVEDFGAFIDIDKTQPRLSGLCHRSEIASRRVEDVRTLYNPGDVVKAKILKVDVEARKISLGLKASYFVDTDEAASRDEEMEDGGVEVEDEVDSPDEDAFVINDESGDSESEADDNANADNMDIDMEAPGGVGLKANGFDWTGESLARDDAGATSDVEFEAASSKKVKRRRGEIKKDLTGDLDKYGPRSVSDFERQLLSQPNNSNLWIQYMAFQLELSEVQQARQIAERALRTIHIRELDEKANIWIAWLNLEVEYGDDDRVEEVFRQACQMQDSLEMHERLASIYISSGQTDKADAVFERIVGNKTFRGSPEIWLNYANFLMESLKSPSRARALLTRALQSVPINEHRQLTAKFAALEFRAAEGDVERGRTIFEGLTSEWPKWTSGWDMFVDLERSRFAHASTSEAKADARSKVRDLYERMAAQKMKQRRAKFVYKKWLEFEEAEGDAKTAGRVKTLAKEYVERQRVRADGDEDD